MSVEWPNFEPFVVGEPFNGFPFCFTRKVDVTGGASTANFHWRTLGGARRSDDNLYFSPVASTEENRELSKVRLSKVFWLLHKMECLVDAGGGLSAGDVTMSLKPKERVCYRTNNFSQPASGVLPQTPAAINNQMITGNPTRSITRSQVNSVGIKMYDGSTDDENNFVGYGMGAGAFIELEARYLLTVEDGPNVSEFHNARYWSVVGLPGGLGTGQTLVLDELEGPLPCIRLKQVFGTPNNITVTGPTLVYYNL